MSYPMLQCKMLDLHVLQSSRSQTCCHGNTRRRILFQPSRHGVSQLFQKIASPQKLTFTNSYRKNSLSPLLIAVGVCVRDHAPPSINRPPVVDLLFSSRSAHDPSHQPTISVNCSRSNQFQRHVMCFLGCSAKLSSVASCDPWLVRNSPLPESLLHSAGRIDVS